MTNGNDLAYPTNDCREVTLTKRELFAAMAMQGILSADSNSIIYSECTEVSEWAVKQADFLIQQLNKEVQQ